MRTKILAIFTTLLTTIALVGTATGSASATTNARHQATSRGFTQVAVAPAVYQLIGSAGITPSPVAPATAFPYRGTLAARFPITGLSFPLTIDHTGGISLAAGEVDITLSSFDIELARVKVSADVSGSVVGDVGRADLFTLGFSDNPSLGLLSLHLTATAAGALNATFGVDAFGAGDTFGYANVVPRFWRPLFTRHLPTPTR